MNLEIHREMVWLLGGVLGVLVAGTAMCFVLSWRVSSDSGRETVANFNARVKAWWVMSIVFGVALLTGGLGSIVVFSLMSLLALREFMTLAPTSRGDHRALLVTFFVLTPLQYGLVAIDWYGLFAVMIPVYGMFALPAISAMRGDSQRFLERTAVIQLGLMICVYNISHAPALLLLDIEDFADRNAQLLLWFVIVVQASDVLQYIWGKLTGRHKVAPIVSPNKTWEGLAGGVISATGLGTALWWVTPFNPWQAALMAAMVCLTGFAGGLIMSAIKRDRGVKDYGTLIRGHGGVLDRIDSLSFAAPLFFHLTRYYFGAG
jgi:phosphatidate cytidylyltransferase